MKFCKLVSATTILVLSTSANAALVGRLAATEGGTDYQAYYDTEANLTWLADANASSGSIYTSIYNPGRMTWDNANAWAANLNVADVTGWRLPNADVACGANANCINSEMGNLFYNVLGGVVGTSISTTHNSNYDLFSNIQVGMYWSSTDYSADRAWAFSSNTGNQSSSFYKEVANPYAWAVYSGDVSAVPVPAAVWLFGSGLIGLVGFARRKKA